MTERLAEEAVVDGRYKVLGRIGSGGMADVYCAEDLQLGRKVALKVLHRRFAEDHEFVERFRREASSAAGLQHQHVVSVYDRGEWDGTYYIAMEYLEGRSLKELIVQEAPLHADRAIDFTIQILRAARFAHRRGVIHRDLKPHNVIVDDEERLKVTDFGIARAGASDMTQTGSIMGTAQYLSPEQAQGHPVDASSDLYSVGVILYEMLTARVPFEGDSAVTIALKHVSERPVPPRALNPEVSPELEAVVMHAMAKDPTRRFRDAETFIAALEQVRGGATGELTAIAAVPPPPLVEEVVEEDRPRSRWWIWLLVLAVLGLGLIAFMVVREAGDEVAVPNVVGVDQASAEARLTRDGFSVDNVERTSEQPRGEVIAQDPSGGVNAEKGSTVRLTVSDGPGEEQVPSVEGLTRERARSRLRSRGFEIEERRETSDDVADGRAIRTSPPEGTPLTIGRTVTLVLSSGPEQVEVPDVTGSSADEATSELQAAGLQVSRDGQVTDDEEPGTVLSQDPAAGSSVDKGRTVTITVAEEPEDVAVPDVTGETQSSAVETLSGAGFQIDVQEQQVDSQDGDGVVLEQDPAGGRAARGATVTITVGRFDESAATPDPATEDPAPAETTPTTPTPTP